MRSETHAAAALTVKVERFALGAAMLVHGAITLLVLASPASFGNAAYYCVAVLGLAYCNAMHWHREGQLRALKGPGAAGMGMGAAGRGQSVVPVKRD